MSHQIAYGTTPKVKKAGRMHDEDRDTIHPKMVTELLSALLMSVGEPIEARHIWKNTREEVLWEDSRLPWHRSPLWLLIRISLQLHFSRSKVKTCDQEDDYYKNFMVFFLTNLLLQSHEYPLSSETMSVISAKLSRRYLKLTTQNNTDGLRFATDAIRKTDDALSRKWCDIQKRSSRSHKFDQLKDLDPKQDTYMSLGMFDEYTEHIAKGKHNVNLLAFQPTCALPDLDDSSLPILTNFPRETPTTFNMLAFETWVSSRLDEWLAVHRHQPQTCRMLRRSIEEYHKAAISIYSGNPEAMSIMYLTILELWIASDQSATEVCRILEEYDLVIPHSLLWNLNLPSKSHMERLSLIETYLKDRSIRASLPASGIFTSFGAPNSFAVRYFDQSEEHQNLMARIEIQAEDLRREKCGELGAKKNEYRILMAKSDSIECQFDEHFDAYHGILHRSHSSGCQKCQYNTQADSLKISVYEWPLPVKKTEAKSTVFELRVPESFGHWRDSTIYVSM
ncbi:hypothetical protein UCREL1_11298 [Eutypa lata UCREL1]|uniref:DUF6606 domain-containing protein n=1 Tax=Eutypa lata (strain UCR-EL1) TaxID=1287681 RepID=M7SW14_EUTLA|nr:hypothetical protein UCREL1_11298 [Eutypa lata UCREL1]